MDPREQWEQTREAVRRYAAEQLRDVIEALYPQVVGPVKPSAALVKEHVNAVKQLASLYDADREPALPDEQRIPLQRAEQMRDWAVEAALREFQLEVDCSRREQEQLLAVEASRTVREALGRVVRRG